MKKKKYITHQVKSEQIKIETRTSGLIVLTINSLMPPSLDLFYKNFTRAALYKTFTSSQTSFRRHGNHNILRSDENMQIRAHYRWYTLQCCVTSCASLRISPGSKSFPQHNYIIGQQYDNNTACFRRKWLLR